jgi:glycerophosphoryl diester phosphodiesterase
MPDPLVIGHRGASGHAYENSAAAFRRAVELGAGAVELDIHTTRDGVLLVHHDPVIRGAGEIRDLTAAALAEHRLPNGEPIPTLAEALALLQGLEVWIEVKTLPPEADATLFAALDQGPTPERYAVHGFDHRIVARLGDRRPQLRRGVLLASYLLDTLSVVRGAGADTLWMEAPLIDEALVDELHQDGLELVAWTANEEPAIRRLMALGVDGICSNYPDRVRRILDESR